MFAVEWQARLLAQEGRRRFRRLARALAWCRHLLTQGVLDLAAGGWVELAWPGVRLRADYDGAREVT